MRWYDGGFEIEGVESLPVRLWGDYARCFWPPELAGAHGGQHDRGGDGDDPKRAAAAAAAPEKPTDADVAAFMASLNAENLSAASRLLQSAHPPTCLLTVSHFLPSPTCLPDWCHPSSSTFDVPNWLDHPAARKAALFSKVAGSPLIDEQIRALAAAGGEDGVRHIHCFGHSHRPKDYEFRGVRYVHHPVGKPVERERGMLPMVPSFKKLWDPEEGEVRCAEGSVIRWWEQFGKPPTELD
mmetsp:Transcript_28353/g.71140  ORF Transcript_28353/g.71140 Transcript_28353/m.71140 type:complete len:240 (+) Transcript_28353:1-720(+)